MTQNEKTPGGDVINVDFVQKERLEDPFQYKLLYGHDRTDGSFKTDQQLRMEYLRLTDRLIYKMTDGLEVVDNLGNSSIEKPDVVVWLDKSARPLSWLTSMAWDTMAYDSDTGETAPKPDFKFVNIDRHHWINTIDDEGYGFVDTKVLHRDVPRSLRSVFVPNNYKGQEIDEAIDDAPSYLDNKTIMIVDEVNASGRTLKIAKNFFMTAFPTAKIGGEHWMPGLHMGPDGMFGNKDLPVWYKHHVLHGRGVGDRNERLSARSDNTLRRLGRYFLSVPLGERDADAEQLRREFKELTTHPDVPVRPAFERPTEDQHKRMSAYNGGLSAEQVLASIHDVLKQR